jgi:DNA-binding transcriptional regulator YhcF (GntR family)
MAMGSDREGVLSDVSLDRAGEVPIGVQLAWALRARVGDGRLAPDQRLPGLRELAETLGINANTVRAVYQRLEREGLIESRQGTGTFVAGSSGASSAAAGQIAAEAARRAQTTGVDPREVAAALYVASPQAGQTPTPEPSHSSDGERRQQLRDQIAALEQTLSELQTRHPGVIPMPAAPRRAGPRLLSVADLEEVRMELVRRLAEAEPLLLEAQTLEREALAARRAQAAQTAAENARARTSAERRSVTREQRPTRPAGARTTGRRATGSRKTRPGPSTA